MNRKLIITTLDNQILSAVLENDEVVELHCSDTETDSLIGNIYVGKVKNIVSNIHAAFIEIAGGQECYFDIRENPAPIFTHKLGKKPLCIGDELLVQVSKDAVKTKVPTVSSKLELTGKYAVLTSGDTRIGASNKLLKADRERVISIAKQYASEAYGIIMRTNAKEAEEALLREEISGLIAEYQTIVTAGKTRVAYSCLRKSPKQYLLELQNIYQDGLSEIVVEDFELFQEIERFLEQNQPEDLNKLRLYTDKRLPLHKLYSMEKHVEDALRERVWMKSGAYLVIQPTEALTVIDVNTGKSIDKKKKESVYFKINMEAAKEAARQIRLRNLSGIIVIDFINLSDETLTTELLHFLERELRKDPIATTLVDMTKLQLVEVTRKKIRKPFHEAFRNRGGL